MYFKSLAIVTICFFCFPNAAFSQDEIQLVSWNIRDFGKTKSAEEIVSIAELPTSATCKHIMVVSI